MQIVLDKEGYPQLLNDKTELIQTFIPGQDSGNPYRGQGGKFGYAPAGVKIILGKEILRTLSPPTRRQLFARAQAVKANQLSLRIINERIHFVLLRDGRRLDDFTSSANQSSKEESKRRDRADVSSFFNDRDARDNDAIIEFARDLNLDNTNIKEQLEKRLKHDLSDEEAQQLADLIREQRVTDLVHYLDNLLRIKLKKQKLPVRIATGRGYIRRSFARLSEEEARKIVDRLRAFGWSESEVQENIISRLPARLRKPLLEEHKIEEKDESSSSG